MLKQDMDTIRLVPWSMEPALQVIHYIYWQEGGLVELAPRNVL